MAGRKTRDAADARACLKAEKASRGAKRALEQLSPLGRFADADAEALAASPLANILLHLAVNELSGVDHALTEAGIAALLGGLKRLRSFLDQPPALAGDEGRGI